MHEGVGQGAQFCDPWQNVHVHVNMMGCVDDATGQVNSFYNNTATPEYLIDCMHQDTQFWSDLLWLSGATWN
eukprot:2363232-Ditylum_brightwellii.AAC.1